MVVFGNKVIWCWKFVMSGWFKKKFVYKFILLKKMYIVFCLRVVNICNGNKVVKILMIIFKSLLWLKKKSFLMWWMNFYVKWFYIFC